MSIIWTQLIVENIVDESYQAELQLELFRVMFGEHLSLKFVNFKGENEPTNDDSRHPSAV